MLSLYILCIDGRVGVTVEEQTSFFRIVGSKGGQKCQEGSKFVVCNVDELKTRWARHIARVWMRHK